MPEFTRKFFKPAALFVVCSLIGSGPVSADFQVEGQYQVDVLRSPENAGARVQEADQAVTWDKASTRVHHAYVINRRQQVYGGELYSKRFDLENGHRTVPFGAKRMDDPNCLHEITEVVIKANSDFVFVVWGQVDAYGSEILGRFSKNGGKDFGPIKRFFRGNVVGGPGVLSGSIRTLLTASGVGLVFWQQYNPVPVDRQDVMGRELSDEGQTLRPAVKITDFNEAMWAPGGLSVAQKEDGTLIAAWMGYGGLTVDFSTDGGRRWGRDKVACGPECTTDIPQNRVATVAVASDGTIHIVGGGLGENRTSTVYHLRSTDGGEKWSEVQVLASSALYGIGGPKLALNPLNPSELSVVYAKQDSPNEEFKVFVRISRDSGETFGAPEKIGDMGVECLQYLGPQCPFSPAFDEFRGFNLVYYNGENHDTPVIGWYGKRWFHGQDGRLYPEWDYYASAFNENGEIETVQIDTFPDGERSIVPNYGVMTPTRIVTRSGTRSVIHTSYSRLSGSPHAVESRFARNVGFQNSGYFGIGGVEEADLSPSISPQSRAREPQEPESIGDDENNPPPNGECRRPDPPPNQDPPPPGEREELIIEEYPPPLG